MGGIVQHPRGLFLKDALGNDTLTFFLFVNLDLECFFVQFLSLD